MTDQPGPTPPQDGPRAPQDGPQRPDVGAETPDGAGGRQTGAEGREVLREQYAAAVECAIGLNVDCGGTGGVYRVRDAVLAVRDAELERAIQELAWYAAAESADAAAGSYAFRAETAEQHRDQLAAALREALDAFEAYWARASYCGPGETAIQPEHLQAWRAALNSKEQQ